VSSTRKKRRMLAVRSTIEDQQQEKTEQQQIMEDAIRQLEVLGGATFKEDDIIFDGSQLVLPETMTLEQGVEFLENKIEELTVETDFQRVFKYRPWDVAFCAWNVMRNTFGAAYHKDRTVKTMFGPMKAPPQWLDISVGPGETLAVPWGNFILPHLPDVTFELDQQYNEEEGWFGVMNASGPKRWRHAVHGVFELVERELGERSLYRGRAFDGRQTPQFLDLSKIDPDRMVYSQDVLTQLEASLWGALRYRETLAESGVPFKRATLLHGQFGVGKSMAINRTGQVAQDEGVTFILVRPGRDDLREAMSTAKMYQPAIVAFEDVDTLADAGKESEKISEILDLFDGIEAKNSDIMLVLTTNHVEKLHKGMMRPGRLDAIITIGAPDAAGIRKLIEVNIGYRLADDIVWDRVAEAMDGYLPAFVVEAAQRAIRYTISRNGGFLNGAKLTTDDLVAAAEGLRPQYDLMQDAKESKMRPSIDDAFRHVIRDSVRNSDTGEHVERIADRLGVAE
jgi:ATPase family protein associated with various cellular activities (AAA)